MKNALLLLAVGLTLIVSAHFTLRRFYPVPYSSPQPGLEAFRDLDEVAFYLHMSMHRRIEIRVTRPQSHLKQPVELSVQTYVFWPEHAQDEFRSEPCSMDVLRELEGYVLRHDMFARSLLGSLEGATDGSAWVIEGRKGDLVLRHRRLNPTWEDDPDDICVMIGKRMLDLAKVDYDADELY